MNDHSYNVQSESSLKHLNWIILILLFLSSWFYFQFDIGTMTITNISELFVLIIVLTNLGYLKILFLSPFWKKMTLGALCIGSFWFIYSLIGNQFGPTLGAFRRLILYPVIGLVAGALLSLSDQKEKSESLVISLTYFPYVLTFLALVNVFVRFREIHDLDFFMRPDVFFMIPFFFTLILKRIKYNQGSWLSLIFYVFAVLATASRGVLLTFVIGLLLYLKFALPKFQVVKGFFIFTLIALSVFLGIYILSNKVRDQIHSETSQISNFIQGDYGSSGSESNNIAFRYFRYQSAFENGLKRPIFGNGLGFKPGFHIGGPYNRVEEQKTAHNYLLTIWMKLGALGLIVFSALFFIPILRTLLNDWVPVAFMFGMSYFYSLVDVMMASTPSAIYSICLITGYFLVKPNRNDDKMSIN